MHLITDRYRENAVRPRVSTRSNVDIEVIKVARSVHHDPTPFSCFPLPSEIVKSIFAIFSMSFGQFPSGNQIACTLTLFISRR